MAGIAILGAGIFATEGTFRVVTSRTQMRARY
jgi:hypothetical protein